jgi:ribosomal protein S6
MARKAKTTSAETLEPKDSKVYEIGFLMSPAVRDEDLATRTDEFKASLVKSGAIFISEGAPEFIDISYEMSRIINNKRVRFTQGYFGWFKIELDPTKMTEAKEALDKNTLLIRYLLITAPEENTVIGKKSLGKILKGSRKEGSVDESGDSEVVSEVGIPEEEIIPAEKLEEVLDAEIKELVKEA